MSLRNTLSRIDQLKSEWDSLPAIREVDKRRLDEKFRLEWNYNSNHIEGNTLTYGQTMLLLIKGKTTGDHDIREYEEMKAHDLAIEKVREMAKDTERPLTTGDICDLNKIILVRPFYSPAITPDGQDTQKKIIPGAYKTTANHVRLSNGEIFYYAEPTEVSSKMLEMLDMYHEKTKELHPVIVAAKLHYEFVLIHPFDDGNGRVARLIMNYHLLKNGYPPIVIKSKDKKNYLTALAKADAEDFESFADYIGQQLIWSLELSVSATKGDSIEEEDDWEKEIELLQKQVKDTKHILPKSNDLIYERYKDSIRPLFTLLKEKLGKFNSLFSTSTHREIYSLDANLPGPKTGQTFDSYIEECYSRVNLINFKEIGLDLYWEGLKRNNTEIYSLNFTIRFDLTNKYKYQIRTNYGNVKGERFYNQVFTTDEQNKLVGEIGKNLTALVKTQLEGPVE